MNAPDTAVAEKTTQTPNVQAPAFAPPAVAEKKATPMIAGRSIGALVPQTMEEAWRLAKAIALAGWAPKSYKADNGNGFSEEKIAVGIMHGLEVGLTPIAALQSIAVINGMPSIFGDGALALVRASGLLEDFREMPQKDATGKVIGYTCYAKRRGSPTPIEREFTLADATRAKLIGKTGPWQEYPQRMLQMRARAWVLRDGFADVLRGLSIVEEIRDITADGETLPPEPPPNKPATAKGALDAFAGAGGASGAEVAPAAAETPKAEGQTPPAGATGEPVAASEAPANAPASTPAAQEATARRMPEEPPASHKGITLPRPTQDFYGKWLVNGRPMLLWRWLTTVMNSTEVNLNAEEKQALATAYRPLIEDIARTDGGDEIVADFLRTHGVTINDG